MNPLTQRLFNHLWQGGNFAYYWTAPAKTSQWFEVGQNPDIPTGRQNVYFGVNPVKQIPPTNSQGEAKKPKWIRSQIDYIGAINTLFAEFDIKDFGSAEAILNHLETLPPASIIIFSGGGYHCYWLLNQTFVIVTESDRNRAKTIQHHWVKFTGSDDGAKDLAHVLRVPDTRNYKAKYKPDYPTVKFVKADFDLLYSLAELEQLSAAPTPPELRPAPILPPANGHNSAYVDAALQAELDRLAAAPNGSRNRQLNDSAFALGQFVAVGALSQPVVETYLEQTALAIGLKPKEVKATIKSGLFAGMKSPRDIPAPAPPPTDELGPKAQARAAEKARLLAEAEAKKSEAKTVEPVFKPGVVPFVVVDSADYVKVIELRQTYTNARKWREHVEDNYPELDNQHEYKLKLSENRQERMAICGRPFQELNSVGQVVTKHLSCGYCEHCRQIDRQNLRQAIVDYMGALEPRDILHLRTADNDERLQWLRRARDNNLDFKCIPISPPGGFCYDILLDGELVKLWPELLELGEWLDFGDLTDNLLNLWLNTPPGKNKTGKLFPNLRKLRQQFSQNEPDPFEAKPDDKDTSELVLRGIITGNEHTPPPPPIIAVPREYDKFGHKLSEVEAYRQGLQDAYDEAHDAHLNRLVRGGYVIFGVTNKKILTPNMTLPDLMAAFNATQEQRRAELKAKQPPN